VRVDIFADEGLNITLFVGVEGEFEQLGYGVVEEHLVSADP
jgi:hypothetical protein